MPSSPLLAASASFLESLYESYKDDPDSVEPCWRSAFQFIDALYGGLHDAGAGPGESRLLYAEWLRRHGHAIADTNPLKAGAGDVQAGFADWLAAMADAPMDRDGLAGLYAGRLAVETAHIDDAGTRAWIARAVETRVAAPDAAALREACGQLMRADEFERFLGRKYPGKKRFGAEGAEAVVVLLARVLARAAASGVDEVVIGSMHRGRLNLMANVLGKDLTALFAEFKGVYPYADRGADPGDVSYHLGHAGVLDLAGHALRVTLLPNPSHLEAVDPVVLGLVRALQDARAPGEQRKVLGVILHTDAAVAGQGVVAESLQLSGVDGFHTGGTIHIVVNNQLGFTTEPEAGRSSRYCTGPWKAIDSLILHANGDDIEAVVRAAGLAVDFRNAHGLDAVIDLVAYRRNGHNEIDEPRFTQPLLYGAIESQTPVRQRFEDALVASGVVTQAACDADAAAYRQLLEDSHVRAKTYQSASDGYPAGARDGAGQPGATGLPRATLERLLAAMAQVPGHVTIGGKLRRLVAERAQLDKGIPWAVGEALALGSLLTQGTPVRLSGQDVVRGAFSHRHFALTDTVTGQRHLSLDALAPGQARFTAVDSPLSEYAVLGFEYGYSLRRPDALTIWEAQFGDFANGAQIMVDQFIASGRAKWRQPSSLVMLLPHGLEGQGPEHSSARIERYLQLACDGNIALVNPSTPANYFHALRRQVLERPGRPLVVIAPKTLLRLPAATSRLEDFETGRAFEPVLVSPSPAGAKRILLCSGKIFYELELEREKRAARDVMIVRLEQLYPMPEAQLSGILRQHPEAGLAWVQEEPQNMGAWSWYDRRLEDLAAAAGHRAPRFAYRGRPASASPAGSFHGDHAADQAAIVASAFE